MERMIAVLGVAVLVLGGFSLYALTQGARFGPRQATAAERALTQVREQLGPQAEVRHVEAGRGRAACGYAGVEGSKEAVAFGSRPHRILVSHDPLEGEFATQTERWCAGFATHPPA